MVRWIKTIRKVNFQKFWNARSSFPLNNSGNVMVLTAFMTPMLLMGVAAAVDMGELYRARVNLVTATDAAALAYTKELSKPNIDGVNTLEARKAHSKSIGEEVFYANLDNLPASQGTVEFDSGDGDCSDSGVTATSVLKHRVFFDLVHKISAVSGDSDHANVTATSVVKCSRKTFEVALALDTSNSMATQGRFAAMQVASSNLVNILFNGFAGRFDENPLMMSVIPFDGMVNVGPQHAPSKDGAAWMDSKGLSPAHHRELDWELDPRNKFENGRWKNEDGDTLTRFGMFDALNVDWQGCIEVRPYPYSVNDEEPNENNPSTLYVPSFAVDQPDDWSGLYSVKTTTIEKAICTRFQSAFTVRDGRPRPFRYCRFWSDGAAGHIHPQDPSYQPERNDRIEYAEGRYIGEPEIVVVSQDTVIKEEGYVNNYLRDSHNFPTALGFPNLTKFTGESGDQQFGRIKWTWKYFADEDGLDPEPADGGDNWEPGLREARNTGSNALMGYSKMGPNFGCTVNPLLDLTTDRDEVLNTISDLKLGHFTNLQAGLAWGWRTLSPSPPFDRGRDYDDEDNRKILILMTDGSNSYGTSNGAPYLLTDGSKPSKKPLSSHGSYGLAYTRAIYDGYSYSNGNGTSNAMNEYTATTCENAKREGVTIYTIAFRLRNKSSTRAMLTACASSGPAGPLFYDAQNDAALNAAFEGIANELSELAISK